MIFIPVLVFSSAYNCDFYIFKREFNKIFWLTCPGLFAITILYGFCFKYIILYSDDLDWKKSLMLGAIFNSGAPDSIAAIVGFMGASNNFITLILGESLVSSGMGFFVFNRCYTAVKLEN